MPGVPQLIRNIDLCARSPITTSRVADTPVLASSGEIHIRVPRMGV